jgi:hypothetical protein
MRALAGVLAALMLTTSFALAVSWPAAASGGGSWSGSGGCDPYINGTVVPVPCSSGSGTGGYGGAGGNAGGSDATGTGQLGALVSNPAAAPQLAPQLLRVQALGELNVPHLQPATAPPRGSAGLVGLPEWFWVPADQWRTRSVTVAAGPAWATVVAAPIGLTFEPGAGLRPVSCSGPGTAYDRRKPSVQQHTDCSYTYERPSTSQPESVYHASLTVTWRVSWTGSGGSGGVLDAALGVPVALTIPVAQGEALVTRP